MGAGITGGQAANSLPRGCAGKERVGQESKGRPQMLGIYWYPVHSSWAAADTPLGMQPCENAFCGTSVYVTIWGTKVSMSATSGRPHGSEGTICLLSHFSGTRAQPQGLWIMTIALSPGAPRGMRSTPRHGDKARLCPRTRNSAQSPQRALPRFGEPSCRAPKYGTRVSP